MDGLAFATLKQLQTMPEGAVIKERRGARFKDATLGGVPVQAEFRATHRALPLGRTGSDFQEWMRRMEEQTAEIEEFMLIHFD
jgi:hypothetical protein